MVIDIYPHLLLLCKQREFFKSMSKQHKDSYKVLKYTSYVKHNKIKKYKFYIFMDCKFYIKDAHLFAISLKNANHFTFLGFQ